MSTQKHRGGYKLTLSNGTEIDLLVRKGTEVAGLGKVRIGGVTLRAATVPLSPLIRTTKGIEYTHFLLEAIEEKDGAIVIHTRAVGLPRLEGAYGDEYNDPVVWPSADVGPVEDRLDWVLRPEARSLGETPYTGFSYAWRFTAAPEREIHRIVARTTWEIGGRAEGNTVLSLGQVTPPIYKAARSTAFTSACLKQIKRFGDPTGMSFQWCSRFSPQQCFDFIASPKGSLVGYWPTRGDVKSFVLKNPGEDVLFVVDATHFVATNQVEIERKCILFAPAADKPLRDHDLRNRWKDAHDACTEEARQLFGIRRSRPLPEAIIGYGQRLEADGRMMMRVGEQWVPSQEWLIAMADTYFEELASRGIRRVIPEPIVQTDPTERGMIRKLDHGIHGDLDLGSVCCVHRYVPAEFWGGLKAWRYYYDKAHRHGMEVGHWIGPHLAYHAPILSEHPDWAMRGFNTQTVSGGYPSFGMAALNWNTGVRQWILDDLRRWKDEGGLDYVWFDSLGNIGFLPVDYSRKMQPNSSGIAEFIADLQRIGIGNIEVEGVSPFGVGASGLFDPNQGDIRVAQDIVGQNTLDWFVGNEDMLCDQAPRIELHRDRTEEQARQILFRCLANRCTPMLGRFSRGFGPKPEWFRASLATYFKVEGGLVRRRLLPDHQGVLWTGGDFEVLFAYEPFLHPLPAGASVTRLQDGVDRTTAVQGQTLHTEAWSVYRIQKG